MVVTERFYCILARQVGVWDVFCGFSLWLIFRLSSCNAVCNIMLHQTALYRHSTVIIYMEEDVLTLSNRDWRSGHLIFFITTNSFQWSPENTIWLQFKQNILQWHSTQLYVSTAMDRSYQLCSWFCFSSNNYHSQLYLHLLLRTLGKWIYTSTN